MSNARQRKQQQRRDLLTSTQVTSNQLATSLSTTDIITARANELQEFFDSYNTNSSMKRVYQSIAIHKRRRAMSYCAKRIPKLLRRSAIREMSKVTADGTSSMPKSPKKLNRHIRRSYQLQFLNQVKRAHLHTWLETHLYQAKRTKMANQWGYRIPRHTNDKAARAIERMSSSGCVLSDNSFFEVLQLDGLWGQGVELIIPLLHPYFETYCQIFENKSTKLTPNVRSIQLSRLRQSVFVSMESAVKYGQKEIDIMCQYPSFESILFVCKLIAQRFGRQHNISVEHLTTVYQRITQDIDNISWISSIALSRRSSTNESLTAAAPVPPVSLSHLVIAPARFQWIAEAPTSLSDLSSPSTAWLWVHPSAASLLQSVCQELITIFSKLHSYLLPSISSSSSSSSSSSERRSYPLTVTLLQGQLNRYALRGPRSLECLMRTLQVHNDDVFASSQNSDTISPFATMWHQLSTTAASATSICGKNTILPIQVSNPCYLQTSKKIIYRNDIRPHYTAEQRLQQHTNKYLIAQEINIESSLSLASVKKTMPSSTAAAVVRPINNCGAAMNDDDSTQTQSNLISTVAQLIAPDEMARGTSQHSTTTSTPSTNIAMIPAFWVPQSSSTHPGNPAGRASLESILAANALSSTTGSSQQSHWSPLHHITTRQILSQHSPASAMTKNRLQTIFKSPAPKPSSSSSSTSTTTNSASEPTLPSWYSIPSSFPLSTGLKDYHTLSSRRNGGHPFTHIYLIARHNNDNNKQNHIGWDLVVPQGWGRCFFLRLIKQGGAVLIGSEQMQTLQLNNNYTNEAFPHVATCPNSFAVQQQINILHIQRFIMLLRHSVRQCGFLPYLLGPAFEELFINQQRQQQQQQQLRPQEQPYLTQKETLQVRFAARKWFQLVVKSYNLRAKRLRKRRSLRPHVDHLTGQRLKSPSVSPNTDSTAMSDVISSPPSSTPRPKQPPNSHLISLSTNLAGFLPASTLARVSSQLLHSPVTTQPYTAVPDTPRVFRVKGKKSGSKLTTLLGRFKPHAPPLYQTVASPKFALQTLLRRIPITHVAFQALIDAFTIPESPLFCPPITWLHKRQFQHVELAHRLISRQQLSGPHNDIVASFRSNSVLAGVQLPLVEQLEVALSSSNGVNNDTIQSSSATHIIPASSFKVKKARRHAPTTPTVNKSALLVASTTTTTTTQSLDHPSHPAQQQQQQQQQPQSAEAESHSLFSQHQSQNSIVDHMAALSAISARPYLAYSVIYNIQLACPLLLNSFTIYQKSLSAIAENRRGVIISRFKTLLSILHSDNNVPQCSSELQTILTATDVEQKLPFVSLLFLHAILKTYENSLQTTLLPITLKQLTTGVIQGNESIVAPGTTQIDYFYQHHHRHHHNNNNPKPHVVSSHVKHMTAVETVQPRELLQNQIATIGFATHGNIAFSVGHPQGVGFIKTTELCSILKRSIQYCALTYQLSYNTSDMDEKVLIHALQTSKDPFPIVPLDSIEFPLVLINPMYQKTTLVTGSIQLRME